jgi:nitric oxide reductase subunit B
MSIRGLRNGAILSFVVSMAILLGAGFFAMDRVPPIPERVVLNGTQLSGRDAILRGQSVYQRYGLMDHGSVWGHGALRGMDFSAETLHRLGQHMREFAASGDGAQPGAYENLSAERRLEIDAKVVREIRTNRYDATSGTLELTPAQANALERIRAYWEQEFSAGDEHYGFLPNTVPSAAERRDLADFFFWAAWAAGTERPNLSYTYTNNWPSDGSVGNRASANAFVWSIASILALFVVLGTVVYVVHRYRFFYGEARAVEASRQLLATPLTPSQRSSAKFFLIAGLHFVVQIFNGGLLAHYTVHPGSFYIPFIGHLYS